MNQHKFAFRVGVLVLRHRRHGRACSRVRLHNVQITQAAEQDPTPERTPCTYHTRVTAARGEILDRNGNVLVANRASYNLVIINYVLFSADDAEREPAARLLDLCDELGLSPIRTISPSRTTSPYTYTTDDSVPSWQGYFRTFLRRARLGQRIFPRRQLMPPDARGATASPTTGRRRRRARVISRAL